jgi:hypothetical protein
MAQDTDRWQALVNTVINLLVAGNEGDFKDQLKTYQLLITGSPPRGELVS